MTRPIKFRVVVSHPIQYYAPFYRALAAHSGMQVKAFFASRIGLDAKRDVEMGVDISWKTDLLAGYESAFLPDGGAITTTAFNELDNPSVSEVLDQDRPDIVLLHGYANRTSLRALWWCRKNRVPALMISDSSLHIGTSLINRLGKRLVLPFLLAQYGGFLSIGDANRRYLQAYGVAGHKIFSVPNMVDEGFWTFRESRAETRQDRREQLGLDDGDFAVLFVGKFIKRKRPGDLIDALARLKGRDTGRKIVVYFAGGGALEPDMRAAAEAAGVDARFLGFVNIDELPAIYCAMDALGHPAELETFGVIVLEAAILGLPLILGHKVGAIGPTSIARQDENALVHRSGDVEGLAAALARLAGDRDLCARMGQASLDISRALDWRTSVRGTIGAAALCLPAQASTLQQV
jgi:glycosyltransferase involved in cell wall biosynthesis